MLERFDLEFKEAVERELKRLLRGDDGEGGLYRGLMSCQDLPDLHRTQGMITAYEGMLAAMDGIAKRMNENEAPVRYARGGR